MVSTTMDLHLQKIIIISIAACTRSVPFSPCYQQIVTVGPYSCNALDKNKNKGSVHSH